MHPRPSLPPTQGEPHSPKPPMESSQKAWDEPQILAKSGHAFAPYQGGLGSSSSRRPETRPAFWVLAARSVEERGEDETGVSRGGGWSHWADRQTENREDELAKCQSVFLLSALFTLPSHSEPPTGGRFIHRINHRCTIPVLKLGIASKPTTRQERSIPEPAIHLPDKSLSTKNEGED